MCGLYCQYVGYQQLFSDGKRRHCLTSIITIEDLFLSVDTTNYLVDLPFLDVDAVNLVQNVPKEKKLMAHFSELQKLLIIV